MQPITSQDAGLSTLLNLLIRVSHAHLRPLRSVQLATDGMRLGYGQPPVCEPGCDGVPGAVRAIHEAGLWVGTVLDRTGFDHQGRVVLGGVGTDWDMRDPFAGHPSVTGFDLRIEWRQSGDLLQLANLPERLLECPRGA